MQIMVMNDDPAVQVRVTKGLMSKGFQVVGMETVSRACAYVKIDPVDILIMGERVSGRLSHTVALAAECANPMVTTMLLTNRVDPEVEELYDLLPSLYALISPQSDPGVVARLALSAVANPGEAEQRMRRNALARQLQPMADWAAVFQEKPPVTTISAKADVADLEDPTEENITTWGEEDSVYSLANEEAGTEQGRSGLLGAVPASEPEPEKFADAFAELIRQEDAALHYHPAHVDQDVVAASSEWPTSTRASNAAEGSADTTVGTRGFEPMNAPRTASTALSAISASAVPSKPTPAPNSDLRTVREAALLAAEFGDRAPVTARQRPLPAELALSERTLALASETVAPDPVRSEWVAAKVRELEGADTGARSRLHLA